MLEVLTSVTLSMAFARYGGVILEDACVEETRTRDLTVTELYIPGAAFKVSCMKKKGTRQLVFSMFCERRQIQLTAEL